jgi:hypothetical protein
MQAGVGAGGGLQHVRAAEGSVPARLCGTPYLRLLPVHVVLWSPSCVQNGQGDGACKGRAERKVKWGYGLWIPALLFFEIL